MSVAGPRIVKVGLDPKKSIQYTQQLDQKTGIITTTILESWIVEWDSAQRDPTANAVATDGTNTLPAMSSRYTGTDTDPTVVEIMPQLVAASAGKVYAVQVRYSHAAPAGTNNANVSKWDTTISFDGVPITETIFFDNDNDPIVNSAGQNFSQQPSKTNYDGSIKVSFKSKTFDEITCEGLRGNINSQPITLAIGALGYTRTFPAETLRLQNFSASPVVQIGPTGRNLSHWQVSLDLLYRELIVSPITGSMVSAFNLYVVDQGYAELVGGVLTTIYSADGATPLNSPQYLDGGSGAKSATAHYRFFRVATADDLSPIFSGIS